MGGSADGILCLRQIEGEVVYLLVAQQVGRDHAHLLLGVGKDVAADCAIVHQIAQSLADLRIVERLSLVVHPEVDSAAGVVVCQLQGGISVHHGLDVLSGLPHIAAFQFLAGHHGLDSDAIVRSILDVLLGNLGIQSAPVGVILLAGDGGVRHDLIHDVGAGAGIVLDQIGFAVVTLVAVGAVRHDIGLDGLAVHDVQTDQVVQQRAVSLSQMEDAGGVIRGFNIVDVLDEQMRIAFTDGAETIDRVLDIRSGQYVAAVEGDAFVDLEGHCLAFIRKLPAVRDPGLYVAVGGRPYQGVIAVDQHDVGTVVRTDGRIPLGHDGLGKTEDAAGGADLLSAFGIGRSRRGSSIRSLCSGIGGSSLCGLTFRGFRCGGLAAAAGA